MKLYHIIFSGESPGKKGTALDNGKIFEIFALPV
jgi:hypothetical protein